MLLPAFILTGAALGAFVIYYSLVAYELRRGERVVLVGVRAWLDRALRALRARVMAILQLPARFVIDTQEVAARARQRKLARSRRRVTAITVPDHTTVDSHLATLRQHRRDTALTPEEAKKLRNLKLEERF